MSKKEMKFATADEAHIEALQRKRKAFKDFLSGKDIPPYHETPSSIREQLRSVEHELNIRYILMKGL